MAGVTGLRYTFSRTSNENTFTTSNYDSNPLFERIGNDEFAELNHCRQVIQDLQARIHELEKINEDLEV